MKEHQKTIVAAALVAFLVGWVVGQGAGDSFPWQPEKKRPVITAIARLAKFGLWLMVVEPAPEEAAPAQLAGNEGILNHKEGW